jgi:hypothetical protein
MSLALATPFATTLPKRPIAPETATFTMIFSSRRPNLDKPEFKHEGHPGPNGGAGAGKGTQRKALKTSCLLRPSWFKKISVIST